MAIRRAVTHAVLAAALTLGLAERTAADGPQLVFLDAQNRPLHPGSQGLGISKHITHDTSLPRSPDPQQVSPDPENFRLQLDDRSQRNSVVYATVQAIAADAQQRHGLLRHVPLLRVGSTSQFRSSFMRLVSDVTDASAPDVAMQLLRAAVGDRVIATIPGGGAQAELSVGSLGVGSEARAPLRGHLRLLILRLTPDGAPVLGATQEEAIRLARGQVEIANEIWAQCFIDFGSPEQAEVHIVNPPPPALLSVSDLDGLPARGRGAIVFRAGTKKIGPIATSASALPEQTAATIARELRRLGFNATVSVNPRADHGAHASADVVVRDRSGALVALSPEPNTALSSDKQQRVVIGTVELSDGVTEFDNTISAVGTLEERTLVKLLADDDPTTIDVLLVNRFVNRDRQGEAFIEADGSSMANTLIFDRNAVRYERQAWVQAHELGHVLLDEPLHPDNVGPDRPWLLMDADARQGRVVGPKRLTEDECAKVRRRSGPGAVPALLKPRR